MPRGNQADSARSGFVIHLHGNDQPSLNHGGMRFDDGQGTAAFGRVVAGMDVVRAIQRQPVQGQSLAPPIEIRKAYRIRPANPVVVLKIEVMDIVRAIQASPTGKSGLYGTESLDPPIKVLKAYRRAP